jgi:hypothetical protein
LNIAGTMAFLHRLHLIPPCTAAPSTSGGKDADNREAGVGGELGSMCSSVAARSGARKGGGEWGREGGRGRRVYMPLVQLLKQSMQHWSLAKQVDAALDRIVTNLNWAVGQVTGRVKTSMNKKRKWKLTFTQPLCTESSRTSTWLSGSLRVPCRSCVLAPKGAPTPRAAKGSCR